MPYPWSIQPLRASELNDVLGGSTAAWPTWATTTGNITVGNGTVVSKHRRVFGNTEDFVFAFILGSTSAITGGPTFTLPAAPASPWSTTFATTGWVTLIDSGTTQAYGVARFNSGTTCDIVSWIASGTFVAPNPISSTSPWTWTTGDAIIVTGRYEVA